MTSNLERIKNNQVNLVKSTITVTKNLLLLGVVTLYGPHTSQCNKSTADLELEQLRGKGNLVCFAKGHTAHMVFMCQISKNFMLLDIL